MTHPLPLPLGILAALAANSARPPSNAPATALWLANPSPAPARLDRQEKMSLDILNQLYYRYLPAEQVEVLKAELADLPPSEALHRINAAIWGPSGQGAPPR